LGRGQKQLLKQAISLLEAGDTTAAGRLVNEQRASDTAEVVRLLDNEQRRAVFDVLEKPIAAEVLEKVDEATRDEIFDLLNENELVVIISELDLDDAADLLAELSEQLREKVLRGIPPTESVKIKKLMSYSEDSAGGLMDPVLISVPEDATVAEATNRIRAAEIDEDFYSVYVVDKHGHFLGDVRIRHLLTSPEHAIMSDLLDPDAIFVSVQDDQEVVRNVFSKNDLIVVPVLDRNHRLVGRITADRIIEVAEEEAAEDMYVMAGTDADELESFSAVHAARVRMTWLLPCMLGTAVTALVMMYFKNLNPIIYVAAVAFVPMIAAISGNAGLQTSTIVVSGLATGHLAALKLATVFTREIRIALVVAAACGVIGAIIRALLPVVLGLEGASAISEHLNFVFAFGIGMFSAIMVATTLGLILPFVFRRTGIDPAISSGPLVTTANDSISVAIYMTLTLLLAR